MFAEYMDELQDPAHREENEAYISQLEGEDKVPSGKELIRYDDGAMHFYLFISLYNLLHFTII